MPYRDERLDVLADAFFDDGVAALDDGAVAEVAAGVAAIVAGNVEGARVSVDVLRYVGFEGIRTFT